MHWLNDVRLNRKDRLKNMLADVNGAYSLSILNSRRVFHDFQSH